MKITIGQTPSMPIIQPADSAESASVQLSSNQQPMSAGTNNELQLLLNQAIQSMLKQLNGSIAQQKLLFDSLPDMVQSYATEILQQNIPDDAAVSQGLTSMLRGQKNTFDQLGGFSKTLVDYSAIFSQLSDTQLSDVVSFLSTAKQELVKNADGSAIFSNNQQEQGKNVLLSGNLTKLANTLLSQPQSENMQLIRDDWQQAFGRQDSNPSSKNLSVLRSILKEVLTAVPTNRQEAAMSNRSSSAQEQAITAKGSGEFEVETQITSSQNKSTMEISLKSNGNIQASVQPNVAAGTAKENVRTAAEKTLAQNPIEENVVIEDGILEHSDPRNLAIIKENIEQKSNAIINQPEKTMPQTANQDSPQIAEKLAAVIRQLAQSNQQNMPALIRQAALKLDLPELQDLWILANVADSAELAKLPTKKLQKAGQDLEEVVTSLKKACTIQGQAVENHKSISFSTPIYLGENQQAVPAYIHIYHQDKQQSSGAIQQEAETWIRICLATENAGNVDLIFHLYNDNLLNLQVAFSETEAAKLFDDYVPAIRSTINESFITLADVNISTAVENE